MALKRGRPKGYRRCKDCFTIHLPGPENCAMFKALPHGCPGCLTANSIEARRDHRTKEFLRVALRCTACGMQADWIERKQPYWITTILKGI